MTVKGRADHAGATVMTARADALLGAAEMTLALETAARSRENTVGTVGEISVRPGAKNVVPGECVFSIDVRAPDQSLIDAVMADLNSAVKRVSEARGLEPRSISNNGPRPGARCPMRASSHAPPRCVSSRRRSYRAARARLANPALAGVPTGMLFSAPPSEAYAPRVGRDGDAALAPCARLRAPDPCILSVHCGRQLT